MSNTNGGPPLSFGLLDGSTTEARDEWTKEIIAWLEEQLAWHTALTPSGRRAIKFGIRRYLGAERGICKRQGEWAKGAKIARETLNRQLAIAVREGLFVTRSQMRPKGWVRGGQGPNIFFPNVPVDVCPGIVNLEPEITPNVTPTVTPKITPTVTPTVTPEVLTYVEVLADAEVPFGNAEVLADAEVFDVENNGRDASAYEVVFQPAHEVASSSSPSPPADASMMNGNGCVLGRSEAAASPPPFAPSHGDEPNDPLWERWQNGEITDLEYCARRPVGDHRARVGVSVGN